MPEADPVKTKLEEISQQLIHMVEASNKEKGIIEEEFIAA